MKMGFLAFSIFFVKFYSYFSSGFFTLLANNNRVGQWRDFFRQNTQLTLANKKHLNPRILKRAIQLRPIRPSDLSFLKSVYASTRTDIQAAMGWTPQQKAMLIQQQFQAQHLHYQQHYKNASFDLILFKKSAIGRLYLDRREQEIRIVDIALLPKYHGQGIGTFLLQQILQEGQETRKVVSLHVRRDNPALRLYQRLGFRKKEEVGERFLLEWSKKNED